MGLRGPGDFSGPILSYVGMQLFCRGTVVSVRARRLCERGRGGKDYHFAV